MANEKKVYSMMGDAKEIAKVLSGERPKAFQGELMCCVVCGRLELSDPNKSSDWRCVEINGVRVYACPKEFPPDSASAEEFSRAYKRVFKAAGSLHQG